MSDIIVDYLAALPDYQRKILVTSEGRRVMTKYNFKLFCFLYFRDVMKSPDTNNKITLSEFHESFIEDAKRYTFSAGVGESRNAWICPRGSGKSTWMMMLIIWLAAHQHQKFVALFSASSTQAQAMLSNIRGQFTSNDLLRKDYPDLVKPATRRGAEIKLSDNKELIIQTNGFICTGRGIDTEILGMRIDNTRPTMILLDDIEGGESNYSQGDVAKRLVTLQDDVLPLSINAHVAWVGTTTRPGGLTESLVHKALEMPYADWVDDENFAVNYWPALVTQDDGQHRSMWPERWPLQYLLDRAHERSFKKNFQCLPATDDYMYWTPETFVYKEPDRLDYVMLSVDPAVTVSERSDYTGLAVVGYSIAERKTYVLHTEQVKLSGNDLRIRAQRLLEMYPQITLIYAEANQGGTLIEDIFKALPVKVKTIHQSVKKEIRASTALAEYEKGNVYHAKRLTEAEAQMVAFPQKGVHDDMVDAIGTGVIYFSLIGQKGVKPSVRQGSYK